MTTDQFAIREKALEEEFFARESEKLKAALRADIQHDQTLAAMSKATGIGDETVLQHLLDAGVGPESGAALSIVPLIFAAWADGKLDDKERTAVLEAAREEGGLTGPGPAHDLLAHWLEKRPPQRLWRAWCEYVGLFLDTLDTDVRQAFVALLMRRAEMVTKASGGLAGIAFQVSDKEREMLTQLAEALR